MNEQGIAIARPAERRTRQARVVWGQRVVTVGGGAPNTMFVNYGQLHASTCRQVRRGPCRQRVCHVVPPRPGRVQSRHCRAAECKGVHAGRHHLLDMPLVNGAGAKGAYRG